MFVRAQELLEATEKEARRITEDLYARRLIATLFAKGFRIELEQASTLLLGFFKVLSLFSSPKLIAADAHVNIKVCFPVCLEIHLLLSLSHLFWIFH